MMQIIFFLNKLKKPVTFLNHQRITKIEVRKDYDLKP